MGCGVYLSKYNIALLYQYTKTMPSGIKYSVLQVALIQYFIVWVC